MFPPTTTSTSPSSLPSTSPSPSPTMSLLRQLPTGSITMSISSMSSSWSSYILPSNSSLLLSLLASLVVLSFIRAAFLCLRTNVGKQSQQRIQVQVEEKAAQQLEQPRQQRSSWAWGLLTWDSLPTVSLPVSLKMVETDSNGRGVGLQKRRTEAPVQQWQQTRSRRGGPAFETPRSYHSLVRFYLLALSCCSPSDLSVRSASLHGQNDHVQTCACQRKISFALSLYLPRPPTDIQKANESSASPRSASPITHARTITHVITTINGLMRPISLLLSMHLLPYKIQMLQRRKQRSMSGLHILLPNPSALPILFYHCLNNALSA